MFKLKNKKSKKNSSDRLDLYDFSHLRASREAADLPDLPNLSTLKSANKTDMGNLPDLYEPKRQYTDNNEKSTNNKNNATTEKKNMKRRSRIIKNNLKELKRYYAKYSMAETGTSYDTATIDDYEAVYNDTATKSQSKKSKIRSKDMVRKYSYLKIQAWSLILIIIVLTIGLIASLDDNRVFTYEETIPVMAHKEKTLKAILPVTYDADVDKDVVGKYNIKYISQVAESLPNGCESVSLAMALSRFIPDITPQEIVDKYLPRAAIGVYNGVYISEDPTNYYIGDPTGRGFGIFADGLAKAAENALRAYNIDCEVINISGCSDDELFKYVDEGNPVIVWSTIGLKPVEWGAYSWHLPTGKIYRYPGNQHCCVLVEHDRTKVVLYDPTDGEVTHDRSLFLRRWHEIGPYANKTRQAIVITAK